MLIFGGVGPLSTREFKWRPTWISLKYRTGPGMENICGIPFLKPVTEVHRRWGRDVIMVGNSIKGIGKVLDTLPIYIINHFVASQPQWICRVNLFGFNHLIRNSPWRMAVFFKMTEFHCKGEHPMGKDAFLEDFFQQILGAPNGATKTPKTAVFWWSNDEGNKWLNTKKLVESCRANSSWK